MNRSLGAFLASACALLLLRTALADPVWWQAAVFEPDATAALGLAVGDIDPDWSRVALLSFGALPEAARPYLESMQRSGIGFDRTLDLDGDGAAERVVVGTYEETSTRRGRFIAVFRIDPEGELHAAFVEKRPGLAGFSALYGESGALQWIFCLACDDAGVLRRTEDGWRIEWSEPYG